LCFFVPWKHVQRASFEAYRADGCHNFETEQVGCRLFAKSLLKDLKPLEILAIYGGRKMIFEQLFKRITPEDIPENVFTLFGRIFPVITVKTENSCNAMVASGGGMAVHFRKPATWLIFPSNRYTLDLIKKEQKYTLSFFPDSHREQFMLLGKKSGRNSNKMKEVELNLIETPLKNMAFEEARLIIECKLTQITIAYADDFYSEEAKAYLAEAYTDSGEIRQYVFGEIVCVWMRK
jgi:flavin reductase (DIM6/NTAB) family NADH-FMN oxidoreductase RutF